MVYYCYTNIIGVSTRKNKWTWYTEKRWNIWNLGCHVFRRKNLPDPWSTWILQDLFAHNCCSFAGEFCRRLGVGDREVLFSELCNLDILNKVWLSWLQISFEKHWSQIWVMPICIFLCVFAWPVEDQFPSWIDRFARLLANASHGIDHVGSKVPAGA